MTMIKAMTTASALGSGRMEVWIVNVGQGNLIIVKFPNGKNMLVDAGTTSSTPGKTAIITSVNQIMGSAKFSTVVLTHPDADHCNLIPDIVNYAPANVHYSMNETNYSLLLQKWFDSVKTNGGTVQGYLKNYYDYGPQMDFNSGAVAVYILAANVGGDANTHSIVLSMDYDKQTIVLTGDATSTTEKFIMNTWNDEAVMANMLCFGHHGSSHSSSDSFLDAVQPDTGMISASAEHMGYGHPRCSVINEVEKWTYNDKTAGVTVKNHRIDCWQVTFGHTGYIYYNTKEAVFLTATQKDMSYDTDGKGVEVFVDQLGA